jgi:hypothetical protein
LQRIEASEPARLFMSKDGKIVFKSRADSLFRSLYDYTRQNLSTNPSFTNDTVGWSVTSGVLDRTTLNGLFGSHCGRFSTTPAVAYQAFNAQANSTYTASAFFNSDTAVNVTLAGLESSDGTTFTETVSKTVAVLPNRTNLVTNPSMEATSGFSTVRTNRVTNPSFEVNVAGWVGTGLSRTTAQFYVGSASGQMAFTALVDNGPYTITTATASVANTVSAYVKAESGKLFRMRVLEYNGATYVGESSTGNITGTGDWQRVSITRTFGSTGNAARIHFENRTSGTHTLYVDGVLFETSPTVNDYFDGATTASGDFTYAWTGTAHASTSIQRGNAVTTYTSWWNGGAFADYQTTDSLFGDYARKSVNIAAGAFPSFLHGTNYSLGLVIGQTYTWSYYVKPSVTRTFRASTNGATIISGGSFVSCPANEWTRLSVTFIATVDTTRVYFNTETPAAIGDTYIIDGALLEKTSTLGEYFDGSTESTSSDVYSWSGTPNASTSIDKVWNRASITFDISDMSVANRFQIGANSLVDFDGVLIEESPLLLDYFDGDNRPADVITPSITYTSVWDGV